MQVLFETQATDTSNTEEMTATDVIVEGVEEIESKKK
jgi:hypothetical protein